MKKTISRKSIILCLSVFFVLAVAAVLSMRPDWRFIISETLRLPDNNLFPESISENEIGTREYTYDQILADSRFSFEDSLMLINEEYVLPEDYAPQLLTYKDSGQQININILESFERLLTDVKDKTGQALRIVSGFRTAQEQWQIISEEGETAASVNSSEHHTGLAMDICVQYFGGKAFLKSDAGRFVNSNCSEYGFIIRYPIFSKDITGIGYEPWHLRYVGLPHSKIIYGCKLTLEEYIESLRVGELYYFEDFIITRQPMDFMMLPDDFENATVSKDNTGCCIITIKRS